MGWLKSLYFSDIPFKTIGNVIYRWLEDRRGRERRREEGRRERMKMEEDERGRKGKEEEATSKDGKRTILSVRKLAQE